MTTTHKSQISLHLATRLVVFQLQAIVRKVHCKMTLNTKRSKVPHIHYNKPEVPNSTLFHSTANRFWVTGHFETNAPNDPKMTFSSRRPKVPHILQLPLSLKFHSVSVYGSCVWVTGHFESSAPNDPKIALNTKRSKVPHIHDTTTPCSKFIPCHPMIGHFENIGNFLFFHWPHNVKIQSFLKKKLYSKIPIGSFCEDCHREHSEKGWLKKNQNCRSSVLKFSLP